MAPQICGFIAPFSLMLWQIAKCSLYGLFIGRLFVGFRGSAYAYSTHWVIIPLYVILAMCLCADLTLVKLFVPGQWNPEAYRCNFTYPGWGVVAMAAIDVSLSVTCLILFIRRLITLQRRSRESTSSGVTEIQNLIVKIFIISYLFSNFNLNRVSLCWFGEGNKFMDGLFLSSHYIHR